MLNFGTIYTSFPLGRLLATPGALNKFGPQICAEALRRHAVGDWSNMDPNDRRLNEIAREKSYGRIVSSYEYIPEGESQPEKIWVITLLDNEYTYTTILLPEEY